LGVISCAVLLGACGRSKQVVGASRHASPGSTPVTAKEATVADRDRDYDGNGRTRYDRDDYDILAFGRAANQNETKAITKLLKNYYAAAASHDGRMACSLMSTAAAEATIEIYGPDREPFGSHRKTCAAVTTSLFRHFHRQMTVDSATMWVRSIRLGPSLGYAILSFRSHPDRHMILYRESGSWRIDAALDSGLV
jgi:hypothetical protein